eukprot:CAMPEP_0194721684 /NCGR_PEP_ID=MMETSP0296-20130528/12906_1 /TAXON_ID=39354 /ORGANISM="Heterosigma akashiwo, Strain CCMP2393" /LENGTH=60 /DNA_ID=CAMNT_0039624399 /DNA_START=244 /DNA_END=423 /DNA_ORIENTATION=-
MTHLVKYYAADEEQTGGHLLEARTPGQESRQPPHFPPRHCLRPSPPPTASTRCAEDCLVW